MLVELHVLMKFRPHFGETKPRWIEAMQDVKGM